MIVVPFMTYLFLFVGMGLVAGSVVHFGQTDQISRFLTIGCVGMALFVIGSYIQERLNGKALKQEGVLQYILYSLLLAVGIGMISGGTQHFLDFPVYASYLLPIGFLLALIAYVLRNQLSLSHKRWTALMLGALLVASPAFLGLNLYAKALPRGAGGHHHGATETTESSMQQESVHQTLPEHHAMTVKTDADFLSGMIPHHQEAVDTSAYVMTRTNRAELAQFTESVVDVQAQEIRQMKQWYQDWLGRAYVDNGQYIPMMGNLSNSQGDVLDNAYMKGMIGHHQGAIEMAQQIQSTTKRPELQRMAKAIIETQSREIEQLEAWLDNRVTDSEAKPHSHSDGHATPHSH